MRSLPEDMKAPYYKRVKGIHEKNKKTLIGHGLGIKDSGPFRQDKSMDKKAKSAPPGAAGGGSLEEDESQAGETVILFPGSFKPPHKGHLSVVEQLSNMEGVTKVIVLISVPKIAVRSDLTGEQVKEIFEIYANSADFGCDVDFMASPMPSPVAAAYNFLEKNDFPPNSKVLLATSTADSGRFPQDKIEKYASKNPSQPSASFIEIDQVLGDDGEKKVSASDMRAIMADPGSDKEQLKKFMPDKLLNSEKLKVLDILTKRETPMVEGEIAQRVFEEILREFLTEKKEVICNSDCESRHEGMSHDEHMVFEEKDRCYRIAKRKYDAFPSAYASGAIVKCRQGKIWKGVNEALDSALGQQQEDNTFQKVLSYLKSKEYDIKEKGNSIVLMTPDRQATKEEILEDMLALGLKFNDLAPGSSFGRFEPAEKMKGSVYVYLKPIERGAAGAGADYEQQVAVSMQNLLPNLDVKTAGFGHGSDLTIKNGNKELKMELKTSSGADFGQFKLAFDLRNNSWKTVRTDKFAENADLFQGIFDNILSPHLEGKIISNVNDPVYIVKNESILGLQRSANTGIAKQQLQKELFGNRADLTLPVDAKMIQHYYSKKGDSFISIEGRGLYALTEQASKDFSIPQLNDLVGKANVRFRIKPHMGTTGVHSFSCALKILLNKSPAKVTDQSFLNKVRAYLESNTLEEMIREELANLLQEKWSAKYKRSIDCKNPKGFSQRAHCQGKKKNEEVQLNEKCWEGYTQKGMKTMFGKEYPNCVKKTNEEVELEERKLGKPSSETNLGDWFKRKGAPGKKGGWVDCNTCRDGKCKPCGRQDGESRSKYPRCRPTPSQCKGYKRRGDNLQKEE